PFDVTTLSAPDGSITAKYVSVGATLTELWVKDKYGKSRDIALGYDDNTMLLTNPAHPVFNAVVGRYANRIKNGTLLTVILAGTFSIPITKNPQPDGPNVYHIPLNSGTCVTLHGGIIGWDRRNWTIVHQTSTSVTYKHLDAADEGFPGNVTAYVTHSVCNGGILKAEVHATATQKTLQGSSRSTATLFLLATSFKWKARRLTSGKNIKSELVGIQRLIYAGQGYDHAWVYDRDETHLVGTSLWSDVSGIRVDISTNQPAVQVYTANHLNTLRKVVHGGPNVNYTK
ncbi:hypothetical protein H0H93_011493, partial [Arthromyces matolae]